MDRLKRKLTSRRGETLVEVLVSILVAGLSVLLLTGMVSAAARMNATARQADAAFFEELSAAETQGTQDSLGSGALSLTIDGTTQTVDVTLYGLPDGLTSYVKKGVAP